MPEPLKKSEFLVETRNLKKHFRVGRGRRLHAVDGVSVRIRHSETLGVIGESGCGKTTFGRTVLRLYEPTSGEIFFDGEDITKLQGSALSRVRPRMQVIFQDPFSSLNPRMYIEDAIAEPMIVNHMYRTNKEIYARVYRVMEMVGLAERFGSCYPHEISGGLRQRVGIARALTTNPQFIVCDEPVSSLDVSIKAQIINLLMDLQESLDLTYMFITHDLSVVRHISQAIAVMYLGQCVEMAPSKEIFHNAMHPYTQALLKAVPDPSLRRRRAGLLEEDIIRGEISNPINPKPVCRFADRCPQRGSECEQEQSFRELAKDHFVACCRA